MSMYYSDGSAFHEITPSTIGALPYSIQEQTDVSNLASSTGLYTNNVATMTVGTGDKAVALPFSQWGMIFTNKDIGTPFQLAMADSGNNYVYKRRLTSTSWEKLSAGYADSAGTATNATNSSTVNGHTVNSDVPANAKFTDTNTTYPIYYAGGLDTGYNTAIRTKVKGSASSGNFSGTLRTEKAGITGLPQYGIGFVTGEVDTQMFISAAYDNAGEAYVGGGNGDKLNWISRIYTTNYKPSASDIGAAKASHTHAISDITNLQTTLNNKIGTDNREVVVSSTQPTNSNCQLWIKI